MSYSLANAKFYLVNPSNPAKTGKKKITRGRITLEQGINPVQNFPSSNASSNCPLDPRAQCTQSNAGYARGWRGC